MFESFEDRKKQYGKLFASQETLWRDVWLLYGAGVLLFLALLIMCIRLEILLRRCQCAV